MLYLLIGLGPAVFTLLVVVPYLRKKGIIDYPKSCPKCGCTRFKTQFGKTYYQPSPNPRYMDKITETTLRCRKCGYIMSSGSLWSVDSD